MSASGEENATTYGYTPHPYIGGRTAALRALAAWRMRWPGAPRVIALTGDPGSGCSRVLTGFLMMCDPEFRKRLPLDDLDPATVPPDLPPPAVPSPRGLTAAQLVWTLADHFGLQAARTQDIFTELAARAEPVTIVVPDVDLAGPVRGADEPARLLRDVLKPLAASENVQLLVDVPRHLAAELADGLPSSQVQIIDLDAAEWADPEGLVLHAETALDPANGAPELPWNTDPASRRTLAAALADRAAGNRLTVDLAARSLLLQPEGFDPADVALLPTGIGEVLDLHARRLGTDPQTLRLLLAPLAFAEGTGLPVQLWGRLVNAVAERDMSQELADGMLLTGPFIQPVEHGPERPVQPAQGDGTPGEATPGNGGAPGGADPDGGAPASPRTLIRLQHPALAEVVRADLPDARGAQARIAMELLDAVPDQDWAKADPYIRDHLAAHTLEAGLLPQLLTDPGLFAHADPVMLRAAVEAVPPETLGAPAHTYLRTAPLLTRTQAPVEMRAALLETAFVEDGLLPYAQALHTLGFPLPWHTLWHLPLPGVRQLTIGTLAQAATDATGTGDGGTGRDGTGQDGTGQAGSEPAGAGSSGAPAALPVVALVVPEGTPGARPLPTTGGAPGAVLLHGLWQPGLLDADPAQVRPPSEAALTAAPLGLSRGADYLRVWARESQEVVTALVSDSPYTGADLSPDGVLVVATERGVTARRITAPVPAPPGPSGGPAAAPAVPSQRPGTPDADAPSGREGDHS